MKSIVIVGLLAFAIAQPVDGAAAQDTKSAIEKALDGPPAPGTFPRLHSAPSLEGIWRNGVFLMLEARLARAGGSRYAAKAASYTCLDIDDKGRVSSAKTCRSSGNREADRLAVTAASHGDALPPPPAGGTSSKFIWVHHF